MSHIFLDSLVTPDTGADSQKANTHRGGVGNAFHPCVGPVAPGA